jgi:hypothetical protein
MHSQQLILRVLEGTLYPTSLFPSSKILVSLCHIFNNVPVSSLHCPNDVQFLGTVYHSAFGSTITSLCTERMQNQIMMPACPFVVMVPHVTSEISQKHHNSSFFSSEYLSYLVVQV